MEGWRTLFLAVLQTTLATVGMTKKDAHGAVTGARERKKIKGTGLKTRHYDRRRWL
jgi:hypothetical protein